MSHDRRGKKSDDLLSDLESLQSLLKHERATDGEASDELFPSGDNPIMAIPTLDRVVETPPPLSPRPTSRRRDFELELLIQEVIDEFIPTIEARLRERLQEIDPEELQRWVEKNR